MNSGRLTIEERREVLRNVGQYLIKLSDYPADTVNSEYEALADYYLDPLGQEDFFGTEGWMHFFRIEE